MKTHRIYWLVLMCIVARAARPALAGDKVGKDKTLVVNLTSPISTKTSQPSDTFTALVLEPTDLQGSIVEGHVRKVEAAQNGESPKSHIKFAFETLTVGDTTYKIQADLKDVVNSRGVAKVDEEGQVIGQGNAGKRALMGMGGAGIGSLAGGMLGGGLGSLIGGAAGGAAGYIISLDVTASSHNIEFYPGTHFTLEVTSKGVDKSVDAGSVHQLEAVNETAMAAHSETAATAPAPAVEAPSSPAPASPTPADPTSTSAPTPTPMPTASPSPTPQP
jgi:cell division septation protein DedD